uniref:Large ribosomal subunit protein bL32c n=1 Tax=Gelidium vagum TaxID=35171 RepID=A0A141SE68_GELVA|nr:ribosomal protein L32 [Gelidium vagum]AMK96586.1 ribosomal protein L32 [Gelidium vagum]
MAVPKKRTSKSKSRSRKANWKRKAHLTAKKSFSLAKSLLNNKQNSFVHNDLNSETKSV